MNSIAKSVYPQELHDRKDILVMHSGGMDSTAALVLLLHNEEFKKRRFSINDEDPVRITSIGFNYGQKHHVQESIAAGKLCDLLGIERVMISLDWLYPQLTGAVKTHPMLHNAIPMPGMANQRDTVVPQRNMLLTTLAATYAEIHGYDVIVHGAVQDDYEAYRDCREEFFSILEWTIQAGRKEPIRGEEDICLTKREPKAIDILVHRPFINWAKADIVCEMGVQALLEYYTYSYSCYTGTSIACGECPACIERIEAFRTITIIDPQRYVYENLPVQPIEMWKNCTNIQSAEINQHEKPWTLLQT